LVKVTIDGLRLVGMLQLAPYRGTTMMTLESAPAFAADVDRPGTLSRTSTTRS